MKTEITGRLWLDSRAENALFHELGSRDSVVNFNVLCDNKRNVGMLCCDAFSEEKGGASKKKSEGTVCAIPPE